MYTTSLSRAYRERRDAMVETFPAAVEFLQGLEVLCDGESGFHMGTAKNVQFYLGETFLFHLRLVDPHSHAPVLMISPQHHGQLREGTVDGSDLLFRKRVHKVISTLRLTGLHVMRQQRGYRISATTPWTFFDLFAGQLLDIVRKGDSGPSQVDLFEKPEQRKRRRKRRRKRSTGTERRVRDEGERMLGWASEVDDVLGLLTAELQDRLGGEVTLRAAAGKARLDAVAAGDAGTSTWQGESVADVVTRALADVPAAVPADTAAAGESELEELEPMVIQESDIPSPENEEPER